MLGDDDDVREPYRAYQGWLEQEDAKRLRRKSADSEEFFRKTGITFNVYGEDEADERLIPFDIVPRILSAREWRKLSRGIEQRVKAINAFLHDIYHRQEIVRAGRVPVELIANNEAFLPQMIGVDPSTGQITSWSFASDGGHAMASWAPHESGWIVESAGVMADGTETNATNILSRVDNGTLLWKSGDRVVGESSPFSGGSAPNDLQSALRSPHEALIDAELPCEHSGS